MTRNKIIGFIATLLCFVSLFVFTSADAFITADRTIKTRADGANRVSDVINDHANSLPNTAPTITLTGSSSVSYTVDATYSELGATCSDTEDGTITVPAPSFSPALDMATAATYTATYTCTDSGSLTDTVTRTVTVNAGGSGPTSEPNLFADGFESGNLTASSATLNTNNFAWGTGDRTSVLYQDGATAHRVYPTQYANSWTDGRDVTAKNGTYSLGVEYEAAVNMAEQRFSFDAEQDLWVRYWVRVPPNFYQGTLNNKFFSIWGSTYDAVGTVTWQTRPSTGGSANLVVQDGGVISSEEQSTPFIDVSTDLNRWMQVVIHVKNATGSGANDGVMELWRRWENETEFTQIHSKTNGSNQWESGTLGYRNGYLQGWANDAYDENTWFLIDDFEMSTESLLYAENQAEQIYALEFSGNTPLYQGSGNAHAGGGYINFYGNPENGAGSGHGTTNISTIDVTDDPLFGTVKGLRDTYKANKEDYSFGNQTLFINHPARPKFYMRMRIKWSDNWQWGNDQLKFCKNNGAGLSTNVPKFSGSGELYISKLTPVNPSLNELYVKAQLSETPTDYLIEDDINNSFGGAGVDINWTPTLGQWYWLEWEVDAVSAGSTAGSYRVWIDGNLYMQLDNVQITESGDGMFSQHELGHVWQNINGSGPTETIYMDWHSIELYSERPSTLPGVF